MYIFYNREYKKIEASHCWKPWFVTLDEKRIQQENCPYENSVYKYASDGYPYNYPSNGHKKAKD